jgi:hypothetical protein
VNTQAARPCVAFLNGEFWGIYNIRERYDDRYFENHYDIDREKVALLEISHTSRTPEVSEGNNSDLSHYNSMYSFFNSNSLKTEANHQKAKEYIDEDNFVDYYISNIYCANTDWPANNNIFWRYKTDNGGYNDKAAWYMDGRYRWAIKDMDFGFALQGTISHNTLLHAMNEGSSGMGGGGGASFTSAESTVFFRKLLENETFKAKFINRFCDVINTNFETNTVVSKINSMKAERAPVINEHSNRFSGSVSSYSSWETQVNNLVSFAQNRADNVRTHLKNKFNLGSVITVTLKTDIAKGHMRINSSDIKTGARGVENAALWSGKYFAETTQTIQAIPQNGRTFKQFIVIGSGNETGFTDNPLNITLGAETTIEAVFE